jgi:hypothetical protein
MGRGNLLYALCYPHNLVPYKYRIMEAAKLAPLKIRKLLLTAISSRLQD